MVDFSHVISGQYNGHAIKKIERNGVTLWEVGGPGPTPETKVDFTGATVSGEHIFFATDKQIALEANNRYGSFTGKYTIRTEAAWPAEFDRSNSSLNITLDNPSIVTGNSLYYSKSTNMIIDTETTFTGTNTIGPTPEAGANITRSTSAITLQVGSDYVSLYAGETTITNSNSYSTPYYLDDEKTQLACTLIVTGLDYTIEEFQLTTVDIDLTEFTETIDTSSYKGFFSNLSKYAFENKDRYMIKVSGANFVLESGWTLSASNKYLKEGYITNDGSAISTISSAKNLADGYVGNVVISGTNKTLAMHRAAGNTNWPKQGTTYAKNMTFTGARTVEIRDDSNNLAATITYTELKLHIYRQE